MVNQTHVAYSLVVGRLSVFSAVLLEATVLNFWPPASMLDIIEGCISSDESQELWRTFYKNWANESRSLYSTLLRRYPGRKHFENGPSYHSEYLSPG